MYRPFHLLALDNCYACTMSLCVHIQSLEAAVTALRCELREKEYRVRQDVCQEFNEQLIEIEDYHRYNVISHYVNLFYILYNLSP